MNESEWMIRMLKRARVRNVSDDYDDDCDATRTETASTSSPTNGSNLHRFFTGDGEKKILRNILCTTSLQCDTHTTHQTLLFLPLTRSVPDQDKTKTPSPL